jgi:hypothetical protein
MSPGWRARRPLVPPPTRPTSFIARRPVLFDLNQRTRDRDAFVTDTIALDEVPLAFERTSLGRAASLVFF